MAQSCKTALAALRSAGNSAKPSLLFVPGRIEFLGKHTDYAGGRSLLCAVERGFAFAFQPRKDPTIQIFHPASGNRTEFSFDAPPTAPGAGHWSNYAIAVARRIARNFAGPLHGVDLAFDSNLPPAAGLSSSSALVIGVFLALAHANRLDQRPEYQSAIRTREDLAGYLGCIENGESFQNNNILLAGDRGVGTMGGSQDHTAILCSKPDGLVQYSFFPVRYEAAISLPPGYSFVIATSGIQAEKTGAAQAAYNRNPLVVRNLLELWNEATRRNDPCLAAAARSSADAPERLREIVLASRSTRFPPATMIDRLDQFIEESERIIPAAAQALNSGNLKLLGDLVDQSQDWSHKGLQNQIPQTIFLAQSARRLGAVAASAFGAGFGGSVWALLPKSDVESFQIAWQAEYKRAFPAESLGAQTFATRAGNSATE